MVDFTELNGYSIKEKIHDSSRSLVFRGQKDDNHLPVIIKMCNNDRPSTEEIERIEFEYNLIENNKIDGLINFYELSNVGHNKAIIMEDIGGISLENFFTIKKPNLKDTLKYAIEIIEIISSIHRQNIIHKDINPSNIIINPESKKIKLIDFSISAKIKREIQSAIHPAKLEGTLAYISPEQTGRMNRSIDFRTDYYSFGITLYRLLTGILPFKISDPMELLHSHLAILPVEPNMINKNIPPVLSTIIMKLLSKSAEDRYQSAYGIKIDLENCLTQLMEKGHIDDFIISQSDISENLNIPEKLYGRDNEKKILLEEFDKVINGSKRIIFLSGSSGIGKSYLINEIQKPLIQKKGTFISGKFDSFKRDIPYSSFIQAFQNFINQILTESEDKIKEWKEKILNDIGQNGDIIVKLIPELELIIGKQQPMPQLNAIEIQNLIAFVFQKLISSFASEIHPLVLFLDDLQWADGASINLLQSIIKNKDKIHLLIICSYRSNEIDSNPPLLVLFDEIDKKQIQNQMISLKPLVEADVNLMISESFSSSKEKSDILAKIIINKTRGNPFFIKEFISNLYQENYIQYNKGWNFNIESINNAKFTDNVVEFMTQRIIKIPVEIQEILKICACMVSGNINVLSSILKKSKDEIYNKLVEAANEGFIIISNNNISFAHDRIQEAVYSSMDKSTQTKFHYKIAQILYKNYSEKAADDNLFSIVHQYNLSDDLIKTEEEILLAQLNLKAAIKAKASAAFNVAFNLNQQGLKLLQHDSWLHQYDLTLSLNTEMCEASYLTGNHDEADKYFNIVNNNAKSAIDKIHVYEIKIASFTSLNHPKEAVQIGINALRMLDFSMPLKASPPSIIFGLIKTKFNLINKEINDLINIKDLTDIRLQAIARILVSISESSYIGDPDYLPIIVLKLLNLSLKHGNSNYASVAYSFYGILLCGAFGDYTKGNQFGKLALDTVQKYNAMGLKSRVYFIFGNMINHWKKHMKTDIDFLLESFQSGSETGDHSVASYSLNHFIFHSFFIGEPINKVLDKLNRYYDSMLRFQQPSSHEAYELWYQLLTDLNTTTEDITLIKGEYFNEEITPDQWYESGNFTAYGFYIVAKQIVLYHHNKFEEAISISKKGLLNLDAIMGMIFVPEFIFYFSLSMTAHYPSADSATKKKYLKELKTNLKKMKKWMLHGPENYEHKYLLMKAEYEVIRNNIKAAGNLYTDSVNCALKNGFLQDEALANELAAQYYMNLEMEKYASNFITQAYNSYKKWGLRYKEIELEKKYGYKFLK